MKGAIGGAAIILMFACGALIKGHLYSVPDMSEGLLSALFGLCDVGSGLIYLIAKLAGVAVAEQPQSAMAEYGSALLMVAGLLNFIMALDAFDIGAGRKS